MNTDYHRWGGRTSHFFHHVGNIENVGKRKKIKMSLKKSNSMSDPVLLFEDPSEKSETAEERAESPK
jgi:hypothetical protein